MGTIQKPESWGGLVAVAAGGVLIGVAAFDPRDDAFPSGRAPVVAAGLVFGLAGLAIFINSLETRYRGVLLALNGTLLLTCFALVPLAIMWHGNPTSILVVSAAFCLFMAGIGARAALREFRRVRGERRGGR